MCVILAEKTRLKGGLSVSQPVCVPGPLNCGESRQLSRTVSFRRMSSLEAPMRISNSPGLDGPVHVAVEQLQMRGRDLEADGFRLARLERHALESPQDRFVGHHARELVADVELHDLVAATVARIGHFAAHAERALRARRFGGDPEILIGERRVTQAVAEG